ncbi:MAG: HU family DNA-binding protein [Desulfovibrionaceae bacterium]|nr:HU family DNA-binding protein [Desulfovibrionaceae bacterium]
MTKVQMIGDLQARLMKEANSNRYATKAYLEKVVDHIFDVIKDDLLTTGRTCIPNIGTFRVKLARKRRVRDPRTAQLITIPEHKVVKFTPTKPLKIDVAEGRRLHDAR